MIKANTPVEGPVRIFISYSHKDENLKNVILTSFSLLVRQKLVEVWHDEKIMGSEILDDVIFEKLDASHIFLALLSPEFLASDYIMDKELPFALSKNKNRELCVVPIVLRECDWLESPLKDLRALPKDGKPITSWSDRDSATSDIIRGMRQIILTIKSGEWRKK